MCVLLVLTVLDNMFLYAWQKAIVTLLSDSLFADSIGYWTQARRVNFAYTETSIGDVEKEADCGQPTGAP